MTEKQIDQGNRLIAEFMEEERIFALKKGDVWIHKNGKSGLQAFTYEEAEEEWQNPEYDGYSLVCSNLFKYHLSWDAMMVVIDKIEGIVMDNGFFGFILLAGNNCLFKHSGNDKEIRIVNTPRSQRLSKLEVVYETVLEFINYHKNHYLPY